MNVARFTLDAWLALLDRDDQRIRLAESEMAIGWEHLTLRGGIEAARNGRPDLVAPLMSAFEAHATTSERDAHEWRDDRYIGASVSVGRFSMGMPGCVRRRETMPRDYRHVGVYVSVAYSGGVDAETIRARGAVILGLLARLESEGVAPDLHLYSETGDCKYTPLDVDRSHDFGTVIQVPMRPLDMSIVAALFCDEAVTRLLPLVWERFAYGMPTDGPWSSIRTDNAKMRAALGLAPHDVLVPSAHISDPLLATPKAWIEAMAHQALK